MPQRGIDTLIWSNPDFADLSVNAKLLFIYLITTFRGNQAGLYRITEKQIHDDTALPKESIVNLFKELEPLDIEWHPDKRLVWVKQFLKHQAHSPQFLTAVAKNLQQIHYPELIDMYIKHNNTVSIPYQYPNNNLSSTESETVPETVPEWVSLLLKFKPFNNYKDWIVDIEKNFSDIDLLEASKEFVDYWSERKKQIKSMKTTFKNSLKNCRKWEKCLNAKELPYTGR